MWILELKGLREGSSTYIAKMIKIYGTLLASFWVYFTFKRPNETDIFVVLTL